MIAHSALWYAAAGLALLATYLIFAAGFHRLVFVSKLFAETRAGQRLSIALLFGPVAGAWTFGLALRLYPSADPWFYVAVCIGVWALIALSGRRHFTSDIRNLFAWAKRRSLTPLHFWSLLVMFLIATVSLARIAWVNIWIPPYSNDPLEYMTAARLIAGNLALTGVYPPVDTSVTSGFYGPWTHPPGFSLLMAWAQILQSDLVNAGAIKFIDAYFLGAGAFVIFVFAGGALNFRGVIAAALYVLTPLLLSEVVEHHVDVSRIALWTGAFLCVAAWAQNPKPGASLLLGVLFGLGWFVHSIGLVALPIFAVLALITGGGALAQRITGVAIAVTGAIAIVAADLLSNYRVFGRLIGDHVALLDYEPLRIAEHLRYARGIYTPYETVRNGLFSPFTRYELAGIVPWLLLAVAVVIPILWLIAGRTSLRFWLRRSMRPTVVTVAMLACLGFFGITLLSALFGSELIVKNMRYAMTSIGLASVLVTVPLDFVFRLIRRRMRDEAREGGSTILAPEIMEAKATKKIGEWIVTIRQYASKIAPHLALVPAWILVVAFAAASQVMLSRLSSFANLDPLTSRASDQVKFGMTNHPQFRMIARLNRMKADGKWNPAGKVLAFRVADFAYYAKFSYLSYIDPAIMPAFKSASASEAYDELRKIDVSYIALPSYTLPEVYNSAIGSLLADANATRIFISDEGYRVLELLEKPDSPRLQNVAQEGPIPVLRFPKTGGAVLKTLPGSAQPLQLDAEQRITSAYGAAPDATLFNGWDGAHNSFFVGAPLKTINGEHLLTASMSGSGFARIAMVYQGQEIQLLWEGLVPSDVRQMSAHFDLAQIRTIASEGKSGPEDDYGLTVSLKAGSSLRLENVTISRVGERRSVEALRADLVTQMLLAGYDFSVSNYSAEKLNLERSFEASEALEVQDMDGRRVTVAFPALYSRETELKSHLYPVGRLDTAVTLGGTGYRDVSLSAQCSRFEPQAAADFSNAELFADRYLMTGRDRIYRFEADIACRAKTARLEIQMWRPLIRFETEEARPVYRFGQHSMRYSFTLENNTLKTIDLTRLAR
jgi:uncharacterized membrane protein YuzA (DUF378 family)